MSHQASVLLSVGQVCWWCSEEFHLSTCANKNTSDQLEVVIRTVFVFYTARVLGWLASCPKLSTNRKSVSYRLSLNRLETQCISVTEPYIRLVMNMRIYHIPYIPYTIQIVLQNKSKFSNFYILFILRQPIDKDICVPPIINR